MKAKIRAKIYPVQSQILPRNASPTQKRGQSKGWRNRKGLAQSRRRVEPIYGGPALVDHQTPAELRQRELEARVMAWRTKKAIMEAPASAEGKCLEKACPFPVVHKGRCRTHLMDQIAIESSLPSTMALCRFDSYLPRATYWRREWQAQ